MPLHVHVFEQIFRLICQQNMQVATKFTHYIGKFQLGKQFFRFQHNRIML